MAEFLYFEELSSTNDYLKEHAEDLPDGTVAFADVQTAGKGRLGKSWVTPSGNISMSMLFRNPSGEVALFPLLCGMAVSTAVERVTGQTVQIKWPNDIILNGKKLCGILCESIVRSSQLHIICGIGVNVNLRAEQMESSALPYATSLWMETGKAYPPVALAKEIALELERTVEVFHKSGFAALKDAYEQRLINRGRQVQVHYQQKTVTATALGVAENGNLLCEAEDGTRFAVNSGEASVRGLYGYV